MRDMKESTISHKKSNSLMGNSTFYNSAKPSLWNATDSFRKEIEGNITISDEGKFIMSQKSSFPQSVMKESFNAVRFCLK